jgi:hypothetical protein
MTGIKEGRCAGSPEPAMARAIQFGGTRTAASIMNSN